MAEYDTVLGSGADASQNVTTGTQTDASVSGDGRGAAGDGQSSVQTVDAAELAKFNKRLDDLRAQMDRERDAAAKREEKLLELAGRRDTAPPADPEALKRERQELAKRIDDGELTGEEQIAIWENAILSERERNAAELKRRDEELAALKAAQEATRLDFDPEYVSHKAKVAEVQKAFEEKHGIKLDRKVAIAIVKETSGPSQPGRPAAPGTTASPVTGAGGGGAEAATAEDFAGMEAMLGVKLTAEQRKALNKKWSKS